MTCGPWRRELSVADGRPSIDHGILSPSGRVSKRARLAALKRENARLFPPGFWDVPGKSKTQLAEEAATALDRAAAVLRGLATGGMCTRSFKREAKRLQAEAEAFREAIRA